MFNRSRALIAACIGLFARPTIMLTPNGPSPEGFYPKINLGGFKTHSFGRAQSSRRLSVAQGKRDAVKRRNQRRQKRASRC